MAWQVLIDFQDGSGYQDLMNWGGESLVRAESLERTEIRHNEKMEPVQNSCKFSALLRQSLSDAILDMDPSDVALVDINEDGSDFFTGFVRPVTGLKVRNTHDDEVRFECLDNSWRLEKAPSAPIEYAGYKVCDPSDKPNSIVHQLLAEAGYTLGTDEAITDTIDTEVAHYRREQDEDSFGELITEQFFNYGYVYYFDASGVFQLYKWLLTSPPTGAATLSDSELQTLDIKIDDVRDEQYVVSWYEVVNRAGVPVYVTFQDTDPMFSDTDYEPPYTTHHFTYDAGTDNRILKTENHYLVASWKTNIGAYVSCLKRALGSFEQTYAIPDGGTNWLVKQFSADGLNGKATVQFRGLPPTAQGCAVTGDPYVPIRVASYAIYADVYVLVKLGEVRNPEGSGKYKVVEYEATNVATETEAKQLAQALRRHNEYGRFKYTFVSDEAHEPGAYVDLSNTKISRTTTARIVRRKRTTKDQYLSGGSWTPIYSYEAIGVAELGVLTGDVETGQFTTPYTGAELQDAINRVNEGLDEGGQVIRIVSGNNIPDDYEPSETGIYLTRTHMGFWELARNDWVVKIENDEGVGKFYVGGPTGYINWTGAALNVKGTINADVGNIGGWIIDDPELRDSLSRMFLKPQDRRLEIHDGLGNTKIALGYLGGVESFEETQYGLYIADGNTVEFEGDINYSAGDWAISDDAAVVIKDSAGTVVGRFGSLGGGDVGLVVGGNTFADTLIGGGNATSTMEDDLTGGGSAIGVFVELSFGAGVTGGGAEDSTMEATVTGGGQATSVMEADLTGGYGATLPSGSVTGTFGALIGGGVASGVGIRFSNNDRALTVRGSFQANTLRLVELPTSADGLDVGELWNDSGTLKIKT